MEYSHILEHKIDFEYMHSSTELTASSCFTWPISTRTGILQYKTEMQSSVFKEWLYIHAYILILQMWIYTGTLITYSNNNNIVIIL